MTLKEALKRAAVTFVAGASGAGLAAPLVDITVWQGMAVAGAGAVLNFVYRASQAWLRERGEEV